MFLSAFGKQISARNLVAFVPLLLLALLALLLFLVSVYGFQRIYRLIEENQVQNLAAIADLKVQQITAWRKSEMRRANLFSKGAFLPDEFERWLSGDKSEIQRQKILRFMSSQQLLYGYKVITLFDRRGVARLSTSNEPDQDDDDRTLAARVMKSGQVEMSDIHRGIRNQDEIRIDLSVPLIVVDAGGERIVGAVVFQIDPNAFLYPLVTHWPGDSVSAETVLVRRDGNNVLFLNELRYQKGVALSMRLPLDDPDLPAALAIRGESSIRGGVDYRGMPVVAVMRSIPGTTWFMVSKIDQDEIFATLHQLKKSSMSLGLAFVLVGGLLVFFWLRANRLRFQHLKSQHDAAVEREMLVRHFESLTRYANDMIMVANEAGQIIEANERAQQTLGYSREELLRMHIEELYEPSDRPSIRGVVADLIRDGALRLESAFQRKDGSIFPVEISARMIEVQGVRYLQGIIRDISERKAVEEELRKSETMLAESQHQARIGSWELDLRTDVLTWSDENYQIFEAPPTEFGASYQAFLQCVHPEDRAMVDKAYTGSVKNRTPYTLVHRLLFPGQRIKYVQEWCETFYDADGRPVRSVGTTQDITERYLTGVALERQERFMRQIIDTDPSLIFVKDGGGRLLLVNRAMADVHGLRPEQMVGMSDPGFGLEPEELEREAEIERQVLETRQQAVAVNRLQATSGGERWFLTIKAPMEQPDGKVHLLGIAVDMTENIRSADLVRRSADKIEDLYNNAPCGYHSLDRDGVLVQVNSTEINWLGYSRDELVGKVKFSDLMTPASRDIFAKSFPLFKKNGFVRDVEYELVCKDGAVLPVMVSATAIYDEQGQYLMSRSSVFDISERKRAQKKLVESEERFRTMADNAPIMIWMVDLKIDNGRQRLNFFNRGWHDFTGLSDKQSQGQIWQMLVHPDDWERCLAAYTEAFRESRSFELECRLLRHDGVYRWVSASGIPRRTVEGQFIGYIGTCMDISEHKLFEELRAEMEHVGRLNIAGEMASGLAHELSQPLSAANIYLDACLNRMGETGWEQDKLRQAVQLAKSQTERAGKIISHLKDLIRKQGQERDLLDLNLLIEDTVGFLEYELQQNAVHIVEDYCAAPLAMVNKVEIEQVLINLIKNAIDSMSDAPTRELCLGTCFTADGIQVTVCDTGKGIAADQLDKLFHPFQTTKKGGLGLGLPICRTLIENHGGRIWVEQKPDGGTAFKFILPAGGMP